MRSRGLSDPYDAVQWETREAEIKNPNTGEVVFAAQNLEFPAAWSQNCTALVAEKYFRHVLQDDGSKVRETSVREMISRVAGTIARWGIELGYFEDIPSNGVKAPAVAFRDELVFILVNQMAAFNSPVWFNVGTNRGQHRTEQCSACFINSIGDDMQSILALGETEGMLYKGGSGSGVNYSPLRSSRERLSGGGFASGPVPFIAKDDFNAGAIKSGGTTRRAAKMAILDIDHGDVLEFIRCKAHSEKASHALIDAGFEGDFRARWGAYAMVPFQNANHSVRVTDEFMLAVENDEEWALWSRDRKTVIEKVRARDLWEEICDAAHFCGDPGLQFDTTINKWHTSPTSGRINGSNPCSEYMYLDDTACNLASINLLKFLDDDQGFDIESYRHTVDVLITAMEILVDGASYPTEAIERNSHQYRPLGLGFTNLGAFLMAQGLPYDSDSGRAQAGFVTAILTARAYARSAELAKEVGTFAGFEPNRASMGKVMRMHQNSVQELAQDIAGPVTSDPTLLNAMYGWATEDWARCIELGDTYGYRNAQASVIAPAGTISFLMDCDTTGIEPDLSLVKSKKLVGGGTITIANKQIPRALRRLGYNGIEIDAITQYVQQHGSAVGAPGLKEEHLPVFDGSFSEGVGGRSLRPEAHILMMGAVQPFVSGAISKTCNIPNDATEETISSLYKLAWKAGLKAVALYRDGSKRTQPMSNKKQAEEVPKAPEPLELRRKLPNDCMSHRHKFSIGMHKGYIHVGLYPDGSPGEIFIKMAKEGSTVSGLMDAIGVLTSVALQYGVPLQVLVDKFSYTNFEPSGFSGHAAVKFAKSPLDYLFRFMEAEFLASRPEEAATLEAPSPELETIQKSLSGSNGHGSNGHAQQHGLICMRCGNPAQRAGACTTCPTCGWNEGCG
jgi:ribonucleoside-diphosphate reductase alpha chain